MYVINSEGKILIRSDNSEILFNDDNYYNWVKRTQNNGEKAIENFKKYFKNNDSKNMGYSINLLDRVIYFAPLNINNWYIVSMISKKEVSQNINQMKKIAIFI